jgi:phthiodiolone/phenolphthiodiolone dimycocerosates ketoreductase
MTSYYTHSRASVHRGVYPLAAEATWSARRWESATAPRRRSVKTKEKAYSQALQHSGKWPEIWIASHGPRMLRATGRYANAWFPFATGRPKDYAASLEVVRAAASDAGRDPTSIIAATLLWVVTGRSRDEVDETLGSVAMKAFALNVPGEVWARHGARHPLGDDFTGVQDLIPQTLDEQTVLSYTSDVPPSLLKECLLTGTPAEVIDQAAEWRDHGLRYAVMGNASGMQPSLRRGLAASVPFAKILRGLRKL